MEERKRQRNGMKLTGEIGLGRGVESKGEYILFVFVIILCFFGVQNWLLLQLWSN